MVHSRTGHKCMPSCAMDYLGWEHSVLQGAFHLQDAQPTALTLHNGIRGCPNERMAAHDEKAALVCIEH